MKAFDASLEAKIIKTITDSPNQSKVLSRINVEWFGSEECIELFKRIHAFLQAGKNAPSSSLLQVDNVLSDASKMLMSSPNVTPIMIEEELEEAIHTLAKFRKGRILYNVMNNAIGTLKDQDPDIDQVIKDIQDSLQHCFTSESKTEMMHYDAAGADDMLAKTLADLVEPDPDFIPTGFSEFDKRTGGFKKGNIIAVASVPGGGKSAMALQMAANQFMMGYKVCLVSFEMDHIEVKYRLLANISMIDHSTIQLKKLTKKHIKQIEERFSEFLKSSTGRLTIWCPTRELDVYDIKTELKSFSYDIVYVDYIGLMKQDPKKALWEILGVHARAAKLAANEMKAAWVLLAQYDSKEEKLKYSSAIQANANFVWSWDNSQKEREMGVIEVKQLKARNAPVYNFYLTRDMSVMKFGDYYGPPLDELEKASKDPNTTTEELPSMPNL